MKELLLNSYKCELYKQILFIIKTFAHFYLMSICVQHFSYDISLF